jgi:hypothetical protein
MPQGTETVTIFPPVALDSHGDPAGDTPDPIPVRGCITWPRTSTEEGRGEIVIDGLNVFMPAGAPQPDAKARMGARGSVWEIDGAPGLYLKGGTEKGTIVALKRRGT